MKQLVYNKIKERGISLIVLVVTVIAAIILISAVLLSLDKNDPRKGATENVFKSDFRTLQEELVIKKTEMKQENSKADINVNVSYDDEEELKKWISSIDTSILNGIVEICNGDLVFVDKGMSEEEKLWAKEMAAVIDSCEDYSQKRGGFYFKGYASGEEVASYTWTNQDVSIEVDESQAQDIRTKYDSYIYSIDSSEYKEYEAAFLVSTEDGTTRISKIKGVAKSSSDTEISPIDFVEDFVVKIDKVSPTAPNITVEKSGNDFLVTLSGANDEDSGINSVFYSLDRGNTWQIYQSAFMVGSEVTEVWSKSKDNAGNETPASKYEKVTLKRDELTVDVKVTYPETNIYKEGTVVRIEATFNGQKPMTAPALNLSFENGTKREAQAVSSTGNKIIYNYTIQEGDNGSLEIENNKYYEKDVVLKGSVITADTTKPELKFIEGKFNDSSKEDAIITSENDEVTLEFSAQDTNINESYLKEEDISLLLDGKEINTLNKVLKTTKEKGKVKFILELTGFTSESGKVSLKIPANKINDKALDDYNWNDEEILETNYIIETKIDTESPEITYIEMTSNNTIGGEKFAKNADRIELKVKFSENLGQVPNILIAGREANLISSAPGASEYIATMVIPTGEVNLEEGYLGYTISGYKDLTGNLGETITKETKTEKPNSVDDTVLYDRTMPEAQATFEYYKKNGTKIEDLTKTNGYAYKAKFNKFNVSDSLSGIYKKQYQWSNSFVVPQDNWIDITTEDTIPEKVETGIYYLHMKVIDNCGNIYTTYKEIKIDRSAPKIPNIVVVSGTKAEDTEWYVSDVELGFENNSLPTDENSGVASTNWTNKTLTKTGKATVTVIDNVGNTATLSSSNISIDLSTIKLKTTISLKQSDSTYKDIETTYDEKYVHEGWINNEMRITVEPEGLPEGVSVIKYQYQVNEPGNYQEVLEYREGLEETEKSSISIIEDGKRKIKIIVTTSSGRTAQVEVFANKDSKAPIITFNREFFDIDKKSLGTMGVDDRNIGYSAKLDVTTADSGSGVKSTQYAWSDQETALPTTGWTTTKPNDNMKTTNGRYFLWVKVEDYAGNVYSSYRCIRIDKTSPTVTINVTYKNKAGNSINTSNTSEYCYSADYTVTATDEPNPDANSGVAKIEYRIDNGSWSTKKPNIPATTGTHTLEVRVTDKVGNVTSAPKKTIKIDRTAPEVSFPASNVTSDSSTSISAEVTGLDQNSKVAKIEYYSNGTLQRTYESNPIKKSVTHTHTLSNLTLNTKYTLYVKVYDSVGNSATSSSVEKYVYCNHRFGSYKNSVKGLYTNWVIGKYTFSGKWTCFGVTNNPQHKHQATIGEKAYLVRCINCGKTRKELIELGDIDSGMTLWCPSGNSDGIDGKEYSL